MQNLLRPVTLMALVLALVLPGGAAPGSAQQPEVQDFALFYEALAPYGAWIDYGNYGPVWYPTGVSEDWRPYLDGRWVPTEAGWVFETEEPWGWATYHYGNWFPTIEYGWVWAPGSTWYPSTAVWRTSDDYIGWAPLPPANYEPVPAFYPEGGYYPGMPVWDLLSPPFWTYCPTGSFLRGFGYPYAPAYSYWNCGCLSPYLMSPFLAFRTYFLRDFFFPSFAPGAFFSFGPPFPFISRVTLVDIVIIRKVARDNRFVNIKHGVPPKAILERHPYVRQTVPEPVLLGQNFQIAPLSEVKLAETNLLRADVTPVPVGVPRVSRQIPKAIALPHRHRVGPEALSGVKGMGLPEKAVSDTAVRTPTVTAPQPAPTPSAPPAARRGPAQFESREDAGARLIEVAPPSRRAVTQAAPRALPSAPPAVPDETLRQRQQEQLRDLERRQQRIMDTQRQEREQLQQRQLRQQEAFQEQRRLLERRQLMEQEGLRRQREQFQLEQQLQQRQMLREQQLRQQRRLQAPAERVAPARPQFRSEPPRSPAVSQPPARPVQPRQRLQTGPASPRSFQTPSGGPGRSGSGRGLGFSTDRGSDASRGTGWGFGTSGR